MTDMIELRTVTNEFDEHDVMYGNKDNEDSEVGVKAFQYRKIQGDNAASRLQLRVPDVPDNFLDLVYKKRCTECNNNLPTINSALSHYNSTKHQTKLAFLFLSQGTYNLPLSNVEIHELETGIFKSIDPVKCAQGPQQMKLRDLIKKFGITEDIRKLNWDNCRLCQCTFSSKIVALRHYSSKKHKENLDNYSPYNPLTRSSLNADLLCEVCSIIVGTNVPMETHLQSKRHQQELKRYMDQVNSGAIVPPMSSRGFYDFNNVEREEANPFDPTKFIQHHVSPSNSASLGPSFFAVTRPKPMDPVDYDRGGNTAFKSQYHVTPPLVTGFVAPDYVSRHTQPGFGAMMTPSYAMGASAVGPYPMTGFAVAPMDTAAMPFRDGRVPQQQSQSHWSNSHVTPAGPTATNNNGPYYNAFSNRAVSTKPSLHSFGPTKFQYTKKQ